MYINVKRKNVSKHHVKLRLCHKYKIRSYGQQPRLIFALTQVYIYYSMGASDALQPMNIQVTHTDGNDKNIRQLLIRETNARRLRYTTNYVLCRPTLINLRFNTTAYN